MRETKVSFTLNNSSSLQQNLKIKMGQKIVILILVFLVCAIIAFSGVNRSSSNSTQISLGRGLVDGAGSPLVRFAADYQEQIILDREAAQKAEKLAQAEKEKQVLNEAEFPLRVIAMGDMLAHDSVNANAATATGEYDYAQFFNGIRQQLDDSDLTFCNQEVLSLGPEFRITGYPAFNAPKEFARDLVKGAGCDLVNLATNHAADRGKSGVAAQRVVWDDLAPAIATGINRDEQEQHQIAVVERAGVKIALLGFTEYSNLGIDRISLNMLGDTALVDALMKKAKSEADIVLVSVHWGAENSHTPSATQKRYAQLLADRGADVIIGTGPHVLQEVTWLNRGTGGKTLVWYSIGNMLSTQLTLAQRTGVIAGFEIVKNDDSYEIANPNAILTYMHYDWSAQEEASANYLARKNLSLTPLVDAQSLLERTRFGVSAQEQFQRSAEILGSEVKVK